jgi:pimeloyl-ACP methyl ester carboxylesterase
MFDLFRCALVIILLTAGDLTVAEAQEASSAPNISGGEYTTVNGRRMYFEQHGQGRDLVLLHGGAGTIQHSFEKQISVLSNGHRVIAIEQIGHGHTPDSKIPFSYSQMAEDTVALLRTLKVENADFIGWSDGGILALLIARRHPELVRRFVISGANTRLVGMTPAEVKEIQESTPQKLAEILGPSLREAYVAASPDGLAHWPVVAKKVWDLWLTPVVFEREDLVSIQAPVLVVCGDKDGVPIDHTLEIFKALPKAQLLVLPGTGHHTFKTAANTLNPIILSFIDAP